MSNNDRLRIVITDLEWKIIELLADERIQANIKAGRYRDPGNRNDPREIEIIGVAAELAFCKMLNIYPGRTFDEFIEGDPDYIINGERVDVKGTYAVCNDLMVSLKVKNHFDLYVVMGVVRPDVFYLGYERAGEIFMEDRIYYPENKNGLSRSPFYKVLNKDLLTDPFWVDGRSETIYQIRFI